MLKDNKCHVTTRGKSYNIGNNSFGRSLVMASLNINSLLAHIDQLREVISNSEIDILSISETILYLPGFEIIRKEKVERVQWRWCL